MSPEIVVFDDSGELLVRAALPEQYDDKAKERVTSAARELASAVMFERELSGDADIGLDIGGAVVSKTDISSEANIILGVTE